ncbi:ferredoxin reductase family protein [Humibacter albus]|uniref:ferredoxin reductase family protein n=1 Tax=Humibacter albus TaxID=427754 RepID=UPI0003B615A2|nr:ferredoxin reductase family protein [Humibacter albus]
MRSRIVTLAVILGGVAVVALWWPSAVVSLSPSTLSTAIAELVGMVGSYLVCVQVLLIARIPWFERMVGLDRLVAWHRIVGTTTLFLILAHVSFMTLGQWVTAGGGPVHAYLGLFGLYPDMLTATIGTAIMLGAGLLSAGALRRLLPYELWYWTHVTFYLAIFLTFLHQISAGPVFAGHPGHRAIWMALYGGTAACVVWWRAVAPLRHFSVHRFQVVAVVPESRRMTSVWIRSNRPELLKAKAGQFMLFRFLAWGHLLTAHPYSISNVPQDGLLRITVADLGDHSGALKHVQPGTKVIVEGPFGGFFGRRRRAAAVLLIAGGAGIGPIRGLAEQFARMGRNVVVVYRASALDDLALYHEVAALPGVHLIPLVGRRAELGYDPLEAARLARAVPDIQHRETLICGPEPMIARVRESLTDLGIPDRKIHSEELSFA